MNRAARQFGGFLVATSFLFCGCGGGSGPPPTPDPGPEVLIITTPSPIQAVQNAPFSLTLQVEGAASAVSWSITSGQLPSGLSLASSTGVLSGTPTAGTGLVTIQAADAKSTASKQFTFELFSKLTINPFNPPTAHLNAPYSVAIIASSPIATWSVSAGALPPGLSLTKGLNNTITAFVAGIPSQVGTFSFTIQVTDETIPQTASVSVTIVVDSHLAIGKAALKNGGQNRSYSDSFIAVNGTPPYRWTVSGSFPSGLSLDATSGQVTGTPTAFGNFTYSIAVSDSGSSPQTDSAAGTIFIVQQLQASANLPPAYLELPYSTNFFASGGTYPYTWSLVSGSLPPGFVLTAFGELGGPPLTQLTTYNFSVQVTDSTVPPYVLTLPATLTVSPQPLSITLRPISPAPINVPYHSQIGLSGGTPPYSWALTSGHLPAGLNLDASTGYIDGIPTQIGTVSFSVRGSDSGNPVQSVTSDGFIQIHAALGRNDSIATATPLGNSPMGTFSISPFLDPLNSAFANPDTDYYRLVAPGGSVVHVQTVAGGTAASNLLDTVIELLDSSGQRLQTCVQPAYSSPCLNDDVDASTRNSALDLLVAGSSNSQATFYLHVLDWRGDARPDLEYFLNISGVEEPLTISPASLGAGATRGVNYQQQFTARGGTGNVTWSVDAGSLPAGWSLSSSGLLSGVATADGFYSFTIKASDAANPPQTARVPFTLQIAEPLVVSSPATWPNACANQPYSFAIQTSGGLPPVQFGFFSTGWTTINLNTSTGVFSGMAGIAGTLTGTVTAGDSAQPPSTSKQTITLNVVNCP